MKINKGSLVYVDVDFQINLKLKQKVPFPFFKIIIGPCILKTKTKKILIYYWKIDFSLS